MNTYTFLTTYGGGTYIDQIQAANVLAAAHLWADRTSQSQDIEHLDGAVFRKAFEADIETFPPAPIGDNPNVWCLYYFSGRKRMEVHIIKTDTTAEPS